MDEFVILTTPRVVEFENVFLFDSKHQYAIVTVENNVATLYATFNDPSLSKEMIQNVRKSFPEIIFFTVYVIKTNMYTKIPPF